MCLRIYVRKNLFLNFAQLLHFHRLTVLISIMSIYLSSCISKLPITRLDSAVVRPGRLMGIHEFRRLNPSEAHRLAQAKGITLRQQPDYSLAEIYQGPPIDTSATTVKVLGFT